MLLPLLLGSLQLILMEVLVCKVVIGYAGGSGTVAARIVVESERAPSEI